MKRSISILFPIFLLWHHLACAQLSMFRGSPEHTGAFNSAAKGPITDVQWKFAADGPIRASAAYDDRAVYFGTASGRFYCLDRRSGKLRWSFNSGEAIHSSAAVDQTKVYFSNNRQTLFALDKRNGKLAWQKTFAAMKDYAWGFDYYYSSPTLVDNSLLIGIKDGCLYKVDVRTGQTIWQYRTNGLVRSTAAVKEGIVYVGDTDGILYALRLADAKEVWRFSTQGHSLKNEDFGFDRRAIISSPVATAGQVIVGGRDGFLYAVDRKSGKELWRVDHRVSWVISSPAVKDSFVITGTSDGHFVQAANRVTGKEIWRYETSGIVWSSPSICNNLVYIGSNEGQLYCLDLFTGRRVSFLQTGGKIWSSPVIADTAMFVATDKGEFYALKPGNREHPAPVAVKKFVFSEPEMGAYFKKSFELKTVDFLAGNGYKKLDSRALTTLLQQPAMAAGSVIVFATNYFPAATTSGHAQSLLRQYLGRGGRVVLLGLNPAIYERDTVKNVITGFNFNNIDSLFGIRFPFNDLRSMKGLQPAFATDAGREWGLPAFWTGFLPVQASQVDLVLGMDENHLPSAWVKRYGNNGSLVQLWLDQEGESDLNFIIKAAEHGLQ